MTNIPENSVLLLAELDVKDEARAQFLQSAESLMRSSRHEEGVLEYSISEDAFRANRFILRERYRDESCLEEHLKTELCVQFVANLPSWIIGGTRVNIANARTISEMNIEPSS